MTGVGAVASGTDTAHAGHELLVRLAGRLPDDVLWRLRDWLAAGAFTSVAAVLPRALLRHRLGITDEERALLVRCVGERSPARRTVDTVLPLVDPGDPGIVFTAGDPVPDLAALSVVSVVAGHPGTRELRQSWRSAAGAAQRVLLVLGADRPWDLTGTLQRLLRVHGERLPRVEVLPLEMDVPPYHQSAVVGSCVLWAAPAPPSDGPASDPAAGAPSAHGPGVLTGG